MGTANCRHCNKFYSFWNESDGFCSADCRYSATGQEIANDIGNNSFGLVKSLFGLFFYTAPFILLWSMWNNHFPYMEDHFDLQMRAIVGGIGFVWLLIVFWSFNRKKA